MNKKLLTSLFVIFTVFILAACGNENTNNKNDNTSNGDSIVLKLSEPQVDDYPDSIAEKKFAEIVEEKSNGRIKVEVYTGGQLGDEVTTIEQAQVGIIDIGRANAGPLTQFANSLGIFSFPFIFESREHLWNSLDHSLRDIFNEDLEESDLIGLAIYDAGSRSFYSSKPIDSLESLKGQKIRVMENDILIDAFELLGTSPTPLSASEVYSGLQMGVIDGGENNVSTYNADGHIEVAENFTLSEHLYIPGVLFMSKQSWDKLSKEDQEIIQEAALESEKIQLEEYDKYAQEAMDKVIDRGNNVIELDENELNKFRDAVEPLLEKHQEEFGELFDVIEESK